MQVTLPATADGLGQLPPAPESLPESWRTEEAARTALLIIIAAGVTALVVDQIVRQWRR